MGRVAAAIRDAGIGQREIDAHRERAKVSGSHDVNRYDVSPSMVGTA
jgi:hypothetical protein